MRVTMLGTGTSFGVPSVACACAVCTSADPRDRRDRASVLVEVGQATILVDTATEFRHQALRHRLQRLDAVLFTHAHADHVGGLDDLRRFCVRGPLPCYGSLSTRAALLKRFDYAFQAPAWAGAAPELTFYPVFGPFRAAGVEIVPVPLQHGPMEVLGFRFGNVAYATDCNGIPPASRALLRDLDLLILDALRFTPHPTHFTLAESLAVIADLRPRRAVLTHISHEISHTAVSAELPPGVELGYDGMVLEV
ncbi:MAG TPA: MBL fold metallo-hydrolase [Chloroflexota bacterium]|nr:MBL fold metallo-hydrolase [Chloroflexota bacterium]